MRQFYMQKWLVEVLIRLEELESRSQFICIRTIDPWDFVADIGSAKVYDPIFVCHVHSWNDNIHIYYNEIKMLSSTG